jgi:hypothetical protein
MTISARFAPVLLALATVFATGCNQVELDSVEMDHYGNYGLDAETGEEGGDEGADGADDGLEFGDEHGALPVCGDGELNSGEECDDGDANDDNGACTSKCTINVCGDGLVFTGVEDCEEPGPMADGGMCLDDCTAVYPE